MGQERESSYLTSEETATSFTTVYTYKTWVASNTLWYWSCWPSIIVWLFV